MKKDIITHENSPYFSASYITQHLNESKDLDTGEPIFTKKYSEKRIQNLLTEEHEKLMNLPISKLRKMRYGVSATKDTIEDEFIELLRTPVKEIGHVGAPAKYYPEIYIDLIANRLKKNQINNGLQKAHDDIDSSVKTKKQLENLISGYFPNLNNDPNYQTSISDLADSLYRENRRIKNKIKRSLNSYENDYVYNLKNSRDTTLTTLKKIRIISHDRNITIKNRIKLIKDKTYFI